MVCTTRQCVTTHLRPSSLNISFIRSPDHLAVTCAIQVKSRWLQITEDKMLPREKANPSNLQLKWIINFSKMHIILALSFLQEQKNSQQTLKLLCLFRYEDPSSQNSRPLPLWLQLLSLPLSLFPKCLKTTFIC